MMAGPKSRIDPQRQNPFGLARAIGLDQEAVERHVRAGGGDPAGDRPARGLHRGADFRPGRSRRRRRSCARAQRTRPSPPPAARSAVRAAAAAAPSRTMRPGGTGIPSAARNALASASASMVRPAPARPRSALPRRCWTPARPCPGSRFRLSARRAGSPCRTALPIRGSGAPRRPAPAERPDRSPS